MFTRRASPLPNVLLLGAFLLASPEARATPEFPGVVEQTLGLTKMEIDPPQGCTLCHTTDSGGTSLRPFGSLMQQDGVQPYQDATLVAALGQVQKDEPQLIADIKAGQDPNDDPGTSSRPTPEYGCSSTRSPHGTAVGMLLLACALGLLRRARRLGR
jgi:hypothetical protein